MIDDGQYRIVDGQITDGGVNENQIAWYKWAVNGIKETSGAEVANMAFMHVPVPEYAQLENGFEMGIRGEGTCTAKTNDGFSMRLRKTEVPICLQVTITIITL